MGQSVARMSSFGFASRKVEDSIFSTGRVSLRRGLYGINLDLCSFRETMVSLKRDMERYLK
jgi:hypothetical protein